MARERARMSATPGAKNEYSRGNAASSGRLGPAQSAASGPGAAPAAGPAAGPAWRRERRRSREVSSRLSGLILSATLLAALLLLAAEFATLYQAHLATKSTPIKSVTVGSHNSYALIPIALLAAAFGLALRRSGTRVLLAGIGLLGLVALLIALLHDLPDAHAVGLADHNSVNATTTAGVGLYLETLGAILLIAAAGLGLVLAGVPRRSTTARGAKSENSG
jgi:hypothetical protein